MFLLVRVHVCRRVERFHAVRAMVQHFSGMGGHVFLFVVSIIICENLFEWTEEQRYKPLA